jgi:hypothetical protein
MCVVINAWEDDYCGDPLFSLVDAIEKEMGARVASEHTKRQIASLKEATKDIRWFMLGIRLEINSQHVADGDGRREKAFKTRAHRSDVTIDHLST